MRSVLFGLLLALIAAVIALPLIPSGSEAANRPAAVPSCTPELVYPLLPGSLDVSGSGLATISSLLLTDRSGNAVTTDKATIEWQAGAVVKPSSAVGAQPVLSGSLSLVITTEAGHRITFDAKCMAGVGAYSFGPDSGVILYANGIAKGWPGSPAQKTFIHFEAFTEDGQIGVYVALIDGRDCNLNFDTRLVTTPELAYGPGSLSDIPSGIAYSETDCTARFGTPKPAEKAPGQAQD